MGELEKAYGAALKKTKRGAFKQAAVAGVLGLGGVYIAKEKYKKRKEAAERMLEFQNSINPLLVQKKTLFNRGLKWWDDHYNMLNEYNQEDNESGYKIALQNKIKDEYLSALQVKESDLDPAKLAEDVAGIYKERLKGYEEQKKLFSDFSHYRETYTPEEGRKKYLAPIMRDIQRIEKNIAKDSNLGKSLFRKLLGEKDPVMLDMPVTGGYGKTKFIRVDSTSINNQAADRLIQTINADQNKLGQADLLKSYVMFDEALLNQTTRNMLLTGESVTEEGGITRDFSESKLIRTVDAQENIKEYNRIKDLAVYGRSGSETMNVANAKLNRRYNEEGIFTLPQFDSGFEKRKSATMNQVWTEIQRLFKDEDFYNQIGKNYDSDRDFLEQMHEAAVSIANQLEDNIENTRTTAGQAARERGLTFDKNRYYEAAFQTVIDNVFKQVPADANVAKTFIKDVMNSQNLQTAQDSLLNETKENIAKQSVQDELITVLQEEYNFKIVNKNDVQTKTMTGRQFLDFVTFTAEKQIKNKEGLQAKKDVLIQLKNRFQSDNENLFSTNPIFSEAYDRTFTSLLDKIQFGNDSLSGVRKTASSFTEYLKQFIVEDPSPDS